jgi:hypothetical protein
MMTDVAERYAPSKIAFGAWLLDQVKRGDHIGALAKSAKADPAFPRDGSFEDVQARMEATGADGDAWAAAEDAEIEYLCR